ncbi:MAG: type III-B CRISPR module RAMP protein Cmr6 [Gammaproteobacteria bacterium]|nr:type III-B CRISPR module RAMP protein Cmr6 [Gammaproteobacteria bacterium]
MTEVPTAAVPKYLGSRFKQVSPGLRFGMYLELWRSDYSLEDKGKTGALKSVAKLSIDDRKLIDGIAARQEALARAKQGDEKLSIMATTVSPLVMGMGIEHPLENGFAFLNPYGLPYLPASSVKGVIRRAAEELASGRWGETQGWSREALDDCSGSMIDLLFGAEPASGSQNHAQGALSFWDVIPSPSGERLDVEVMTPHQTHYYQDGEPPHDSGNPNPIAFLAVPPSSACAFHMVCDLARLQRQTADLNEAPCWKALLEAAFEHAFLWLGFGAKTAVGYGAMKRDREQEDRIRQREEARERDERKAKERQERLASMDPIDREIEVVFEKRTDAKMEKSIAIYNELDRGRWKESDKIEVARRLKTMMQQDKSWREKSNKRNPEKDKPYRRTRQVMDWLEGQ